MTDVPDLDAEAFTPHYIVTRDAYWTAQQQFREAAVAEVRRLLPDEVCGVLLVVTGGVDPRLTVSDYIDTEGESVADDLWDTPTAQNIDQIATDMEIFNWDEADSFLLREGDGFIIKRED